MYLSIHSLGVQVLHLMYVHVLCTTLVDVFVLQIFDEKMTYNDKLIALRDWKLQVIDKVCHPITSILYT